ncbi:MAG: hypothetical protein QNJ46_08675 [Leptolyngbyaceae cyanobacterium MO_188.B28]|nr:hypothetical protein [Leptolyngbyaceae cyanobacterium MO_188.B28]
MKFAFFSLGLLSFSSVLTVASTVNQVAIAQCVMADVAIQVAVHGSEKPAQQTNDVEMVSDGPCTGNTSVSTSRQVHVGGTDEVRQTRRSRHQMSEDRNNRTGVNGPTVAVPVEVQVDVDNAAYRLR